MKSSFLLLLIASLSWSGSASAQLYKFVDANGKISYSDTPPATHPAQKLAIARSHDDALPAELANAIKQAPVTLYTTRNCAPCDEGRTALIERGIPHTEKTVTSNEDMAMLKQAGGDQQLPLLLIGSQKYSGFQNEIWQAALTAAAYPVASQLPANYRHAAASAAAPPKAADAKATPAQPNARQPAAARTQRPVDGDTPPGFRF